MNKIKKKVAVLGQAGVGKTTMIQMFCSQGQSFAKEYHMTQVCDIASKIIEIDDETDVELFFFDVSGRELYREPVSNLIKECDFNIFVYDLTSKESLSAISTWADISKKANNNRSLPGIIVGTKKDLTVLREIRKEAGDELGQKLELESFEVSCENYEEISEAIELIAKRSVNN